MKDPDMIDDNQHIDPVGLLPKFFSGEATSREVILIENWLSERPENLKEFEDFRRLWNIAAPSDPKDIDLGEEWARMESVIEPGRKIEPAYFRILRIAAIVVLVSVLSYTAIRLVSIESIKTPATQTAQFTLPDGTVFSLNAGSKITYKKGFGITHRNLSLKGEGFFDVAKSRTPFIIDAGVADIRVTGTKFNVSAYTSEEKLTVTVTEGKVLFYPSGSTGHEALISAGKTGSYNKESGAIAVEESADPNDFAWITGKLEFVNTPLYEVSVVLTHTYHISFEVDDRVKDCAVTVSFENQEADSVLNVLKSTLDLTLTRKGGRILISGEGC